jgi:hypothetical protein
MVEGGRIDHAGHANSIDHTIGEVLEFDKAVKAALDFAEADVNTLVIVTADHETGGLQKNGASYNFTVGNHTSADVPVFAAGVGAAAFTGAMDNVDICIKLKLLAESAGAIPDTTAIAVTGAVPGVTTGAITSAVPGTTTGDPEVTAASTPTSANEGYDLVIKENKGETGTAEKGDSTTIFFAIILTFLLAIAIVVLWVLKLRKGKRRDSIGADKTNLP